MTSMTYKSTVHNAINRKNLRSAGTRPRQMKTGELHVAFKGQKCSGKLKLCSSLPTHTTRVDLDSQSWAPKARMLTPYTTSGLRCPVTAARRKRNGLENLVRKVPTRKARSMPPELGHVVARRERSDEDLMHGETGFVEMSPPPTKQGSNASWWSSQCRLRLTIMHRLAKQLASFCCAGCRRLSRAGKGP